MNTNGHCLWPGQHNGDSDFSNFLNFPELPIDFNASNQLQNMNQLQMNGHHSAHHNHHDSDAMDTNYGNTSAYVQNSGEGIMDQNGGMDLQHLNLRSGDVMGMGLQRSLQYDHAQMGAQFQLQHLQHLHNQQGIPPTPSSLDLQGGVMTPHMFHALYGMKDDTMFTPLVSPAVTPLDTNFSNLPDYSTSGAGYFSPLTSPALEAQHQSFYPYSLPTANTSKASSPVDGSESPIINKKLPANAGRRKSVAANRNPARVVRESPSMKPIRKKAPSALSLAPEIAQNLVQHTQTVISRQQTLNSSAIQESGMGQNGRESSAESISPEPMPEALMAPPPAPGSRPMPGSVESGLKAMQAKPGSTTSNWQMAPPSNVKPATPASLMKLPKSGIPADAMQMPSAEASLMMLDRGQLGHAYSGSKGSSREDSPASDEQPTPTMNANSQKTPRGTPLLMPANSGVQKAKNQSPVAIQPLLSKAPSSSLNTPRLTPKIQPTNSSRSKRSVPASPALIPKISPHIKPLLSNAAITAAERNTSIQTAASIILTNKSNYQNIVEGNSSSLGLLYPEDLSTGLTSKRTSHKIAEQGRRNRINTALQEMATLLPPITANATGEKSDGDAETSRASSASQMTSKAVTVERAIDYIRALQNELAEAKSKLQQVEGKLDGKDDDGNGNATAKDKSSAENSSSPQAAEKEASKSPNGGEVVMSD